MKHGTHELRQFALVAPLDLRLDAKVSFPCTEDAPLVAQTREVVHALLVVLHLCVKTQENHCIYYISCAMHKEREDDSMGRNCELPISPYLNIISRFQTQNKQTYIR